MKWIKRLLLLLVLLVAAIAVFALVSGKTYLFAGARHIVTMRSLSDIDDYQFFDNRTVANGTPQPWPVGTNYGKESLPDSTQQLLQELQTVAVVKIQGDSLRFEQYNDGYSDSSLSGSFSVAKSITSLLIGAALREGKIKSINQPIGDFIPAFKEGEKSKVTIRHVLTMSSGTDWYESYKDPLSVTAELYYGDDVEKTALSVKMINEPGTLHYYKSGDTQLLGLLLEKATGKPLSEYAAEKLWKPIGAVHPALWSVDKPDGKIKAYCCFNTNARDFARIGQLMLQGGNWNGVPVIDSNYFKASITPCGVKDKEGNACDYYGFQWWIDPENPEVFYARGILGQYIIVIPSTRTVIVRLGRKTSTVRKRTVPTEVRHLINWGLANHS
jgi:CubicO group peptidase (beta-lactamase class C family)